MEFPSLWNFLAVLAVLLFMATIGFGWWRLLNSYTTFPYLAHIAAPLIAIFTAGLAFVMGARRAARKRAIEQGYAPGSSSWLLLYPFLFAFSALGLLTSFFYLLEGGVVLQEQIDHAQEQLAVLENGAVEALRDPAHEAREARVRQLLSSLQREINHPGGICGVGREATDIIRRIREELPDYHQYARGAADTVCEPENLDRIYRSYEEQALDMLRDDHDFVASGGRDRQEFLAELRAAVSGAQEGLRAAEGDLRPSGPHRSSGSYSEAQQALLNASTVYSRFRDSLAQRSARPIAALPAELDVSSGTQIDSIGAIIPSLVRRLRYLTTWVYLVLALLIDIGLVLLLSTVVQNMRRRASDSDDTGESSSEPGSPRPRRAHDPTFLWVNQYS